MGGERDPLALAGALLAPLAERFGTPAAELLLAPVNGMPAIAGAGADAANPDYRFRIELWAIAGCAILFVSLIELVRRNRLKERYSFLWFLTACVLAVFTLRRDWLEDLARIVGVYYPPTALFLLLVFFMLLILIHFSTVISQLLNEKQTLAQSQATLEARVRALERWVEAGEATDDRAPPTSG